MKTIYPLLLALVFTTFQVAGQINYLGLGNTITTDLTLCNDTLYASTYNGLFKKNTASQDTNWTVCGLKGNHVVQTLVKDYSSFISVVEIGQTKKTRIWKSSNGGSSFNLLLPDTSLINSYQYLDHLAHPGNSFDTLYSLNHRKKTFDGGKTWLPVKYNSLRFIKVHPVYHNMVFMGGETMIFSAELKRSTDYGNFFENIPISGYFSGDNSIHDMEFAGYRWICVGEGVIVYTDSDGAKWVQTVNTWSAPSPWAMYILDIEKSANGYMYASGETGTTNRIGLFISSTEGAKWDTLSFPAYKNTNPGIKCLAVKSGSNTDHVFLGGVGVYRYDRIISSVPLQTVENQAVDIYPNPSQDGHFTIRSGNVLQETILNMEVFDILGRPQKVDYNRRDQFYLSAKGIFVIRLMTGKQTVCRRIINK
jgi:hypothetical protein